MLRWVVIDEADTIFEGQKSILDEIYEKILQPKVMSLSLNSKTQINEEFRFRNNVEE